MLRDGDPRWRNGRVRRLERDLGLDGIFERLFACEIRHAEVRPQSLRSDNVLRSIQNGQRDWCVVEVGVLERGEPAVAGVPDGFELKAALLQCGDGRFPPAVGAGRYVGFSGFEIERHVLHVAQFDEIRGRARTGPRAAHPCGEAVELCLHAEFGTHGRGLLLFHRACPQLGQAFLGDVECRSHERARRVLSRLGLRRGLRFFSLNGWRDLLCAFDLGFRFQLGESNPVRVVSNGAVTADLKFPVGVPGFLRFRRFGAALLVCSSDLPDFRCRRANDNALLFFLHREDDRVLQASFARARRFSRRRILRRNLDALARDAANVRAPKSRARLIIRFNSVTLRSARRQTSTDQVVARTWRAGQRARRGRADAAAEDPSSDSLEGPVFTIGVNDTNPSEKGVTYMLIVLSSKVDIKQPKEIATAIKEALVPNPQFPVPALGNFTASSDGVLQFNNAVAKFQFKQGVPGFKAGAPIIISAANGARVVAVRTGKTDVKTIVTLVRLSILADTNRDGVITDDDIQGKSNPVDYLKNGALLMVNCGQTGTHAKSSETNMDDDIINGKDDVKNLSELRIELPKISDTFYKYNKVLLTVDKGPEAISDANQLSRVFHIPSDAAEPVLQLEESGHVEKKLGDAKMLLGPNQKNLSVDVTDILKDGKKHILLAEGLKFGEQVKYTLTVVENTAAQAPTFPQSAFTSSVVLLCVPFIAIPNTQPIATDVQFNFFYSDWAHNGEQFHDSIQENIINNKKLAKGVIKAKANGEEDFSQDRTIIGFCRKISKDPSKESVLHVFGRLNGLGEWDKEQLSANSGWYFISAQAGDEGGAYGVLPPIKNDTAHPYGYIMTTRANTTAVKFFLRQKVQTLSSNALVTLDPSGIGVGHIDEIATVVPLDNKGGFTMFVSANYGANSASQVINAVAPGTTFDGPGSVINFKTYKDAQAAIVATTDLGKELTLVDSVYTKIVSTLSTAPISASVTRTPVLIRNPPAIQQGMFVKESQLTHDYNNSQPIVFPGSSGDLVFFYPANAGAGATIGGPGLPDFDEKFKSIIAGTNSYKPDFIIPILVDASGPYAGGGELHCLTNVVREPLKKH